MSEPVNPAAFTLICMFWCFSNFSQYLPYAQEKKLQMIGYTDKDILIYFKNFLNL